MSADTANRGRESFSHQSWNHAFVQLSAADREVPLEAEDLERMATAAYLTGRDTETSDLWARAHQQFLSRGDTERAAHCAFWLGFELMFRGEIARSSGWLARARRLLDEGGHDSVVRGYLLIPGGIQATRVDSAAALEIFTSAVGIGERFADRDLVAIARNGQGRALISMGRTAAGLALLDEVMVGITAGEASTAVVGLVYCSVIEACHDILDLRRAHEWTTELSRWCASQPELVAYRGACLVRRAEILQLHGAWPDALDEVARACERLSEPRPHPGAGAAFYQRAELHRLRGELAEAEQAYRQASECGRKLHPGLALLRLARGQVDAAAVAIRGALDEAAGIRLRSATLGAFVEIMLAANDIAAARAACDELSELAAATDAPFLHALSAQAKGAVLLAESQPQAALAALRGAWNAWRELDAPYDAARVRVLIALACRALGDADSVKPELEAARHTFEQLGAAPDVARVDALLRARAPLHDRPGQLTGRELEVLRLVATGKTNRAIAGALDLSEKTVARHVSNIFTKLGISSRSAATAYAYENGLV